MQGKTQGKGEAEGGAGRERKRCLIPSRHIKGIKRTIRREKNMKKVKGKRKMKGGGGGGEDLYAISFSCKDFLEFVTR